MAGDQSFDRLPRLFRLLNLRQPRSLLLLGFLAVLLVMSVKADTLTPGIVHTISTPGIHQEIVQDLNLHQYNVNLAGTLDGNNTLALGHAQVHRQEPNLSLKIENAGNTAIHNPKIVVNRSKDWSSIESMLSEIINDSMTDREKALAIWRFVSENSYHYFPAEELGDELHDPVIFFNVYGYGFCDDFARNLSLLWEAAGLRTRLWVLAGHVVSEVYYDGAYHMMDADMKAFYLLPDNSTIASVAQIAADRYLVRRAHLFGRYADRHEETNQSVSELYGDDDFLFANPTAFDRRMDMVIRPDESFEWRWGNTGKYLDIMYHAGPPSYYANGRMTYTPNLNNNGFRNYLLEERNLSTIGDDGLMPKLHLYASQDDVPGNGYIIINVETPYVIVGGSITGEFFRNTPQDDLTIYLSADGETWEPVWTADRSGTFMETVDIDKWVAPHNKGARYAYAIKIELSSPNSSPDLGINYLKIETDLQMAPLSLPALSLGMNEITYSDETYKPHRVLITHEWQENNSIRPPEPPPGPIFPPDGAHIDTTRFEFQWQEAADPDGDDIEAYHFFLSEQPDMAWALSSNFDRVVMTNTYEVPFDGLLNDGAAFYWQVRSQNSHGVWSEWSDIWRFIPHGPGAPGNLHFTSPETLVWEANTGGTLPVYYEIYGATESGFVPAACDIQSEDTGSIPGCLIARTSNTTYHLPKPVGSTEGSYHYFRVAAVDDKGVHSAPAYVEFGIID